MIRRAGLLLGFACLAALAQPNCALVPGWTQAGAPRSSTADNLFEYMDGNAEGYISITFMKCAASPASRAK